MESRTEKKKILIGWQMANLSTLVAGNNQANSTPEQLHKISAAASVVAIRPIEPTLPNVISDIPTNLQEYANTLMALPELAAFVQEGWAVKIADLEHVCTVQPTVESVNSVQRIVGVQPGDMLAIAKMSLPIEAASTVQGAFDPTKNTWQFSSPNPNLRIIGAGNNGNFFGFGVAVPNSYVQVVECQGRFYLRDGNHRAFGFISNGITKVPVLYRKYDSVSEMGLPQGLFPPETLLSLRPPMLRDFSDPEVSLEADFPITTKVVIVQGLEVSTI